MLRLVVVLPLEQLASGDGFPLREWPLHVTAAPTFVVRVELSHVVAAIKPVLANQAGLSAVTGDPEGFGPSQTIPVTVVVPNAELTNLHVRLVDALREVDAVFDDPQYIGSGYRAHVTTTAPALRNARVMPRPTPRTPPVTRTIFPSRSSSTPHLPRSLRHC